MKKGIEPENPEWEKLKNTELYKYIKKDNMYLRKLTFYSVAVIDLLLIGLYYKKSILSFLYNLPVVISSNFDTFFMIWVIVGLFLLYVFLLSGLKWRLMLVTFGMPIFVMSLAYLLFPSAGLWLIIVLIGIYTAVVKPFVSFIKNHFLGRTIVLTQPIKIRNAMYSPIQPNHFGYIYIDNSWWSAIGNKLDFPVGTKITISKVENGLLVIEKAPDTDNHSA